MPDYTGNLNLAKPIPNEDSADIRVINENMDKIDEWSTEINKKTKGATSEVAGIVKYGTDVSTALEGSKLAEILGIEYGGVLNNNNQKVTGKGYYDTANKKIYKCTTNTSINYADSAYFEEISNNDLLGKLQNLITTRFEDTTLGSGGYISFYLSAKSILISLFNVNTPNTAGGDGFYIQIPSWVSDLLPLDITFPFVVSNFGTCAEVFLTKRGIRIYTTQGVALPSVSGSITIPIR